MSECPSDNLDKPSVPKKLINILFPHWWLESLPLFTSGIAGDNIGWADLFGRILQNSSPVQQHNLQKDCCKSMAAGSQLPNTASKYHLCVRAVLQEYPESCDCIRTDVECVEVNLLDVPPLSANITWL